MENLKKSFLVRGNNIVGFSDKKNFSTAPLGTVLSFAGQARPNGYLLCDGASYKVTDYPDLYAVIGNTYGGDSTNFNVPNLVDASQSPAPTMIYIIKAFHTNEGVDSDAGSGEENKIDSISVNGSPVSIDENKNVDITVPDAYDDTALVKRVSDIESDYAKTTEIPSKVSQLENDSNYLSSIPEEYVTETELEAKGYLTEHQDLSDYATKDEIPTVPSKVSELTNDSNYQTAEQVNSTVTTEITKVVANAPEDFDTLKEMSDWIAGHEDDASAMNSAISDNKANIETLQTDVANINTSLGGKLDKTFTGTDVANKILSTDGDGNVVLKDGNEDDTMLKSVYDTDDDGIVDKADAANTATNATDATNAKNLKKSDGTTISADSINTKLSKVDTTDNLSVELAKKIDKPASATNGQVLTYNGTSNEWEAQDSKGGSQSIISDAYDALKTYVTGEYCIYNNLLWKCLVQHNGQTPTEGTYWTNVSVANEIASVNSSLTSFGRYTLLGTVNKANPNININRSNFNNHLFALITIENGNDNAVLYSTFCPANFIFEGRNLYCQSQSSARVFYSGETLTADSFPNNEWVGRLYTIG